MKNVLLLLFSAAVLCPSPAWAQSKKLKVFILVGQSNMEGHARTETFDHIGDDPATAPLLKQMRGPDGKPRVCDRVWISYFTGKFDGSANGEGVGKLTAGFGARGANPTEDGGKIGPEFTFGLTMEAAYDGPILLIKTAWGGRSLFYNFRPPSAGVFPRSADDIAKNRNPEADSGHFYRLMIGHVKKVLADPKRVCPEYDPAAGYEIAGFVWFQGFNDLVSRDVYPDPPQGVAANPYAKYGGLLADFIRDVRKDLGAPDMPFVIGVLGVGGKNANPRTVAFREAMTAPSLLPEFKGNVAAVPTAPFWAEDLAAIDEKRNKVRAMAATLKNKGKNGPNKDGSMTPDQQKEYLRKYEAELITPAEAALWKRGASNAGYHYFGCAKTFALAGKAFAEANLELLRNARRP